MATFAQNSHSTDSASLTAFGSRLCKNARLDWGSQFSAVTEELVMM
jgi:hypothetical protein